jgi:hypothetical protein
MSCGVVTVKMGVKIGDEVKALESKRKSALKCSYFSRMNRFGVSRRVNQ